MRFALLVLILTVSPVLAASGPKAFDLWPATNGAAPTTYVKNAPSFQTAGKPWKFAYGSKIQVKIDADKVVRGVTPYYFGNNASWWSGKGWFMDPDRVEKAKQAGIKFWRWPGGSSSDEYHWDGKYDRPPKRDDPANMNALWAVSTDDFIEFCRQTNSEAIVTANYAAARYADAPYAADMAARWVKYFNFEKKFKVRYWEIGNENYGPWEQGNTMDGKPQLTGDVYGKDFKVIAEAMRKADPDIYIGAVAYEKDGEDEWVGHHFWTKRLLEQLNGKADYLILHNYFGWPFDPAGNYTDRGSDALLGNVRNVHEEKKAVETMIESYAPVEKGIPFALTEFNIENSSPKSTIQLINGLFTAKILGEQIKAGYVASNIWDWKNGLDAKNQGDHAMLSSGDNSIPDATPRPTFYAYALFDKAFGDKMVTAESSEPAFSVYASRFAGGELGVVIVNEFERNKTAVFDLAGFKPSGKFMGWVLTAKSLEDRQVSWNGTPGPLGGGGPFPINSIQPYRATFKLDKPLQVAIQARSATGIIFY